MGLGADSGTGNIEPQMCLHQGTLLMWIYQRIFYLCLCLNQYDSHVSTKLSSLCGHHAFRCSAPAVWNSLPKTVVDSDSIAVFKSKLDISLLPSLLSFLFSLLLAHCLAQRLWSYDHMALYKCVYYYYYYYATMRTTTTTTYAPYQVIIAYIHVT